VTAMARRSAQGEEVGAAPEGTAALEVAGYDLALGEVHSGELRAMVASLDEVRGCLKAAIGWKSLTDGGRRELLLRALRNAEGATRTLLRLDTTIDLTAEDASETRG
jgi:hypothetical protein